MSRDATMVLLVAAPSWWLAVLEGGINLDPSINLHMSQYIHSWLVECFRNEQRVHMRVC